MKIAVYTAAVPRREKNQFKRDLLMNFAQGARSAGDEVIVIDDLGVVDCDIAVLQGWIGMKTAPHLELRRSVIKHQRRTGGHTLVIDSNLLGFLAPQDFNRYLRYSLDGIFPTTGYYFDQDPDAGRWSTISKDYDFTERAWRDTGQYVLVCLQRHGGWSMDGFSVLDWLATTLPQIKQYTRRPIMVRGHPGSTKTLPLVRARFPGLAISDLPDIRQDLDRAWCTVTYNSSPGVASVLWGVPTFVTDPEPQRSQAWPWACSDLARLDAPYRPDRQDFYTQLAQCHFRTDKLTDGSAWCFMRARLPQRPKIPRQ
jgi:hypothetical protein